VSKVKATTEVEPAVVSVYRQAVPIHPHEFRSAVSMLSLPEIVLTPLAYNDLFAIVDMVPTEVGMLGTVAKVGSKYVVDSILLPSQEVNAATTEIAPSGVAEVAEDLIKSDGIDKVNRIRFWAHSHGSGTTSSGQDDTMFISLSNDVDDFFIRCIVSRSTGDMEMTLYLIEKGIVIKDCPWSVYTPPLEASRIDMWKSLVVERVRKKAAITVPTGPDYYGSLWDQPEHSPEIWRSKFGKYYKKP
jgi:hypothetical protein